MTVHPSFRFPSHGSPEDRGSADAYYGRPYRPHKRPDGTSLSEVTALTPAEIRDYERGYDNQEWGEKYK